MNKIFEHSLDESFVYDGLWWLPDEPEAELCGRISYTPGKWITLDLIGTFGNVLSPEEFHVDIMQGVTTDGYLCTLYGYLSSNINWSSPGTIRHTMSFRYLFVGHHFSKMEQIMFSEYKVAYWGFDEWRDKNLIKSTSISEAGKKSYSITYNKPEGKRINLPALNGSIDFDVDVIQQQELLYGRQVGSLQIEFVVRFTPDEPRTHDWLTNTFFDLERFLILTTGYATSPSRIYAIVSDDSGQMGSIYTRTGTGINHFESKREMLLDYQLFSWQLEKVINNWFRIVDELRPVIDIFFGTIYQPDMYLELRFLALMQSLEGYQRLRPQSIQNANSLVNRLNDLFDSLSFSHQNEIHEDFSKFREEIVNTRDYYTHYIPQRAYQRLDHAGISDASKRLRIFMTTLLLREVGLDDLVISIAISRLR